MCQWVNLDNFLSYTFAHIDIKCDRQGKGNWVYNLHLKLTMELNHKDFSQQNIIIFSKIFA